MEIDRVGIRIFIYGVLTEMRFKALRNLLIKPGLAVVKAVRQGVGRVQDSIGYIRHGPGYMLYGPTAGHATGKLSNGRSGRAYITEPVRNKGMPVQTLPLDEQRHVDILHTLPTHHEVEEHEPIMQNRDEVRPLPGTRMKSQVVILIG